MARDRHQSGWVHESSGKVKKWYGEYFIYEAGPDGVERRRHKTAILGLKAELKKWQAEKKLAEIIAQQAAGVRPSEGITLKWFWENRYRPMHQPSARRRQSSYENMCWVMDWHIIPMLGEKPITEIAKFDCQSLLNGLAEKGMSFSAVQKGRTYLKAVLNEAVEGDYIGKNPARGLEIPATAETKRPFLTPGEIQKLFSAMHGRDQLILRLFLVCGLRRGELFALRWDDWTPGLLLVDEAVWRGKIQKPKTASSTAPIYLPPLVEKELSEWHDIVRPYDPARFIFESSAKSDRPLNPDAWMRRHLNPAAKRAGVRALNYQALRRTFATQMQKCGTVKDVQRMLRHSSAHLAANVYMQAIPESVRQSVESLDLLLFGWLEKGEGQNSWPN